MKNALSAAAALFALHWLHRRGELHPRCDRGTGKVYHRQVLEGAFGGNFRVPDNVSTPMSGTIAPETPNREGWLGHFLLESLGEIVLDGSLLEVGELLLYLVVPVILIFGFYLVAGMIYHLMFDPNAMDVASRLDLLSIDPDKWIPHS
jgi:hypothetical protein